MGTIIIIIVVVFLIFAVLGALTDKDKLKGKSLSSRKKSEKVTVSIVAEDSEMVSFLLIENFVDCGDQCQQDWYCIIYKDASPWVKVGHDLESLIEEYNVKNYRWKDSDSSDYFEYPKLITAKLREEWQKINGKIEPRKKSQSTPIEVDITVRPVTTEIKIKSLKKWNKTRKVEGTAPEPYEVDMKNYTCTCPDFVEARSKFPETDVRRICKHLGKIFRTFEEKLDIQGEEFVTRTVFNLYHSGFSQYGIFKVTINESIIKGPTKFYILKEKNPAWVGIVFFGGDGFGGNQGEYNLRERRWKNPGNPFPKGYKPKYKKAMQLAFEQLAFEKEIDK